MPSSDQIERAMDEWLTTQGLTEPEIKMIEEFKRLAAQGEDAFMQAARFFYEVMRDQVTSAINKARHQGICQCWPD